MAPTRLSIRVALLTVVTRSHTATEFVPADGTGTANISTGMGELDNGTTMTVRLTRLIALWLMTTAGRRFKISEPTLNSSPSVSYTHLTLPTIYSV